MVCWCTGSQRVSEGGISFCNLIPCILALQLHYQPFKYAKKNPMALELCLLPVTGTDKMYV